MTVRFIHRLRFRLKVALLSALLACPTTVLVADARPAYALPSGSGIMVGHGFDACTDPSESQLSAWWPRSPWYFVGLYIGGSSMSCSQPNLSAQYLNDIHAQGWQMGFFWVGPQAPCSGYIHQFSSDPGTAYQQGKDEARAAFNMLWQTLDVDNFADHTPLTVDLEAFNGGMCNAQAAANSYIQGWVDQLHIPTPQVAGVYGSTCASNLDSYASLNPFPDFIWGASYDNNQSTSAMPCVNPGHWWAQQRLKQYVNTHWETWGGVSLSIDTDCANGPTAPNGATADNGCR